MTNKFVLLGCFSGDSVLIVEKHRPKWQAGRLNLPGGKVEPDESWEETARRELFEETGLYSDTAKLLGWIHAGDVWIACFKMSLYQLPKIVPREEETELPEWVRITDVVQDSRLMENLKVVIPLMAMDVSDWVVTMKEESFVVDFHPSAKVI